MCHLGSALSNLSIVDAAAMVRRMATAEDPPEALGALGIVMEGREGARSLTEPPGLPTVPVTLQELAAGFVRQWSLGTRLSEWAALVLMLTCIEFPDEGTDEEDRFVGSLWDASAGEPISDDAVSLARKLSGL
jgi:hypothetical protein